MGIGRLNTVRQGEAYRVILCVLLVVVSGASCTGRATRQPAGEPTARPELRKTFPGLKIDGRHYSDTQIVVKFHKGSAVHVKDSTWVADNEPAAGFDTRSLASSGMDRAARDQSVRSANQLIAGIAGATIRPLIDLPAGVDVQTLRAEGEAMSHRELADLSLYSSVLLSRPDAAAAEKLVQKLGNNPAVEQGYPQPVFHNAEIPYFKVIAEDIPPTTAIDLRSSQGYMNPAPAGINVPFARKFPGGRGETVSIIDVEDGWRFEHEDLPGPAAVFSWHGVNHGGEHGTAVAGELWGVEDSIGVTGISPRSRMGWSAVSGAQFFPNPVYSPAAAIVNATADLSAGDVILIEQHGPVLLDGIAYPTNACNPDDIGYLPVEIWGAEFDAISLATAKGIVVVEAAGNGMMSLNSYPEFDRTNRDSGAIIVGASRGAGNNNPACFTNYGNRVDAYAWGDGVATLGYGETASLQANGGDGRQWYTASFSGTSSASPIVAGAAALIQGIRKRLGKSPLNSTEMRSLLQSTGTAQGSGVAIGTQPNLQAALGATLPDDAILQISSLPKSISPGQTVTGTVTARNNGPRTWTGLTHHVVCKWANSDNLVSVKQTTTASVEYGNTLLATWTTTVPPAPGVTTLGCHLISGGILLASTSADTIVGPANQFNAEITAFQLPATMPYGIDGNDVDERTALITVRNAGTEDWTAQWLSQLALQSGPVPASRPLPGPVAAGAAVTVPSASPA